MGLGCSDSEQTSTTNKTTENAKEIKKDKKGSFNTLNMEAVEKASNKIDLVPSPIKMQKMLNEAGIAGSLGSFLPKRSIGMNTKDQEQLAIRCGILTADLTLTVDSADPKMMISQLKILKMGMKKLNTGSDIQGVLDELIFVAGKTPINRKELTQELDELSSVIIPEIKHETDDWIVPLIQAGSWLEGVHLISSALQKKGTPSGINLLKQPGAAKYFMRYIDREGRQHAPVPIINQLKSTLNKLDAIANKESISIEDINMVQSETAALLSQI